MSLSRTFLLLALLLAAGYILFKLLASKSVHRGPSAGVLAPVGGVLGWVNSALGTVNQVDTTATRTADAADRVLTSAENIYNRFSTFGQSGDTGDN
jgi:hypothetical protein